MNVTELKEAILLCREAGITPFVWGKHGLGKSSGVAQLCESMEIGMIDMRCSQLESSDLRGLPDRDQGRTLYLPPADLPNEKLCSPSCTLFRKHGGMPRCCSEGVQDGDKARPAGCRGILFLDELNRGEDDVIQATFQLVLDRGIGTYNLPSGWSVCVAGNYIEGYTVNSFSDPAFIDRFCHLDLSVGEPYKLDWADYMTKHCGAASDKILQFVGFNDAHLMGKTEADRGFTVQPSPRSWEMVAKVLNASKGGFSTQIVTDVIAGLIGPELARQFERFATDVLPSDVINRFKDVEKKIAKMSRNQKQGLVWGVVSNAKDIGKEEEGKKKEKPEEVDKKMGNVLDFMAMIATVDEGKERDMAVMLARALCEGETKSLGGAVISNPHLAKMCARFKSKKGGKSWIQAINDRPQLQSLMSRVAFGSD